ncbi:MAG: AAA family ATPase [Pleurocapsa sp. MO_226.B13]|nr:AAA family ATPase [Pleurocapsa sp. MO_226.B13]
MFSEVMEFFGLERELDHLGFFETASQKHLEQELKITITQGRLIAISGIVGSGKTTFLQRLMADLTQSKEVIVSRSLAVESEKVNLLTLMTALFYDLSTDKVEKVPSMSERRERYLLELIKKARVPVALFVDDAHGLHSQTLVRLKRLVELVRNNGDRLSVILAGHPKLKNDLKRPTLEEIGGRTHLFTLEGIRGHQEDYIQWLLTQAALDQVQPTDILSSETISFLGQRLSTPLQIEQYLTLAMNEAYQVGQKPISAEFMETVLAIGFDDLEPNLIRHGYNVKSLARLLNVRPAEVRSFLHGQLPPEKTQDLRDQILKIGIPL